jgi:arylsulfatase A-like enzyme
MIKTIHAAIFSVLACCLTANAQPGAMQKPRNIILLYADDLGYGDLGCYGCTDIPTPNVDRLCRDGLRFLDAHAEAATCTPSRYSILTGKYAFRKKGTDILPGDANLIIPPAEPNLASVLKNAGYATGIVGKWHLGLGYGKLDWNTLITPGPAEIGFDYAFVLPATLDRVPCVYLEEGRVLNLDQKDPIQVNYQHRVGNDPTGFSNPELVRLKGDAQHSGTIVDGVPRIGFMAGGHSARWVDETMPDILVNRAIKFIEENKTNPFFLYYAMPEPHVPRLPSPRFAGRTKLGSRGDVIVQMDWEVGQVLDTLDRLGLSKDTMVIFSSDNGPILFDGYHDDSITKNGAHRISGPYRGGKYDALEGGTRVPFIVRWPKYVKPGESKALVSQMDLLASLASVTRQTLPNAGVLDSINILPAFLGQSDTGRESLVEQGSTALGFRAGDWKLIKRIPKPAYRESKAAGLPPTGLYNLDDDPQEKDNLVLRNPAKAAELEKALEQIVGKQYFPTGEEQKD